MVRSGFNGAFIMRATGSGSHAWLLRRSGTTIALVSFATLPQFTDARKLEVLVTVWMTVWIDCVQRCEHHS